jgi:Flp pilus assembly protein TadG
MDCKYPDTRRNGVADGSFSALMFPIRFTPGRPGRYHRGPMSARRPQRSAGQAMVEFAIVAPILFFLLLGIFESGLLLFVVGSARFGSGEVARQESESGNAANADLVSLQVLQRTAIGTTSLAGVTEVDIYRLIEQANGTLTVDALHYNRYQLDGTPIGAITWPSSTRNVTNGQSDFLGVTLQYRYNWKTGIFLAPSALNLSQTFEIRLEPQTY